MAWQVDFDADLKIVELSFAGNVTGPELVEAAAARIEFGGDNGTEKYLIDAEKMLAPKSTIMDVLEIPEKLYFDKGMKRTSCIAVVAPSDPNSHWISEFYENASVLRGWRVRTFDNREAAKLWLLNYGK